MQISKMMLQATVSFLLLLSTAALLCHCIPASELEAKDDLSCKQIPTEFNYVIQRRKCITQLDDASTPGAKIILSLDEFKIGYAVALRILAPDTGYYHVQFKDGDGNLVFLISVRHSYRHERNTLVLNTKENGKWGREVRPTGFKFEPGVFSYMLITTTEEGFRLQQQIHEGSSEIAFFPYRL